MREFHKAQSTYLIIIKNIMMIFQEIDWLYSQLNGVVYKQLTGVDSARAGRRNTKSSRVWRGQEAVRPSFETAAYLIFDN